MKKWYACIKNGKVGLRASWSNPEHIPRESYDKLIEIPGDLAKAKYQLDYINGKVIPNKQSEKEYNRIVQKLKIIENKIGDNTSDNITIKEQMFFERWRHLIG